MLRSDIDKDIEQLEVEIINKGDTELVPENITELIKLLHENLDKVNEILEKVINNSAIFDRIFRDAENVLSLCTIDSSLITKVLNGCSPEQLDRLVASDHERDLEFYHAESMAVLNIINLAIRQGEKSILALKDYDLIQGKDLNAFIICLRDKMSFPLSYYNDKELFLALKSIKIFIEKIELEIILQDEVVPISPEHVINLMNKYPHQINEILENVLNNSAKFDRIFRDDKDVLYLRFIDGNLIKKVLTGCNPEQLDHLIASDHERNLEYYHPEVMAVLKIINPAIHQGKEAILALQNHDFLKRQDLKTFIVCLKDKLSFSASYYNNNELYLALRNLTIFVEKLENPSLKILCIETILKSGLFSSKNENLRFNPKIIPTDIQEEFKPELKRLKN